MFRKMMGTIYYETSKAKDDVFGQYASAFDRTKLVVITTNLVLLITHSVVNGSMHRVKFG